MAAESGLLRLYIISYKESYSDGCPEYGPEPVMRLKCLQQRDSKKYKKNSKAGTQSDLFHN
jgi:hypothetical protein